MLTLQRLTVRGFRGFAGETIFEFDNPTAVLFGPNHSGKSSTVNAIEWCLFGDEITGKATGIRERVGWPIPNRNLEKADVLVSLGLDYKGERFRVIRTQQQQKRRQVKQIELHLPDGSSLTGEEAETRLSQLTSSSFRDFATTTHLHQENIRAILTDEPRVRNDAIDRLLGLSQYTNFLVGIKEAKCEQVQKLLVGEFEKFEAAVGAAVQTRRNDVDAAVKLALTGGAKTEDLNEAGALARAERVRQQLLEFAGSICVGCDLPAAPAGELEIPTFMAAAKGEISRLRRTLPGLDEQNALFATQEVIAKLKTKCDVAIRELLDASHSLDKLNIETGGREQLDKEIEKISSQLNAKNEELKRTNERTDLVNSAIEFLEKAQAVTSTGTCPLCHNESPDLLEQLKLEWEQTLSEAASGIKAEIASLKEQRKLVEKLIERLEAFARNWEQAKTRLEGLIQKTAEALGKKLSDKDDLPALLQSELVRIQERLEQLTKQVAKRQEQLSYVELELDRLKSIQKVLEAETKLNQVEGIQESEQFRQVDAVRDKLAEVVADVNRIADTVSTVLNQEAREKIEGASEIISDFFARITNHPVLKNIRVAVASKKTNGQNSYRFLGEDNQEVTPLLSQGDFNALALSIFLGLGLASGDAATFGFMILDDPSQSLGMQHKERLANVLNDVGQYRDLIISTMDGEFQNVLQSRLMRAKTTYQFGEWDPVHGPAVERTGT